MRRLEFVIPPEYDEKTVYTFLKGKVRISLALLRSLKRVENGIELNGVHTRTVDLIHSGDILSINIPDDGVCAEDDGKIKTQAHCDPEIIFEDEDILVVNKPALLPIHESHNHQGDTLQNVVGAYLLRQGKSASFRAVGRLDKGTSGLVVCALNRFCAARLSGSIKKEYLAVVTGEYNEKGTVDVPIYRPDPMKTYRTCDERGDRAVTHYNPEKTGNGLTLMRIKLETGRTHQIRVHFSHLGTPLVGDTMYGKADERITHQCLHCAKAVFIHPLTGEEVICEAPMPEDMQKIADSID
ncbi:MAG: RluA family pseudouridine synthase [Acutalibacteraceae bacterium]